MSDAPLAALCRYSQILRKGEGKRVVGRVIFRRPALFLDRDGVMIQDLGYVNSIERTNISSHALTVIREAKRMGFWVFVVTNQAGVARGYFNKSELESYNLALMQQLASQGAFIDDFVYCPHHPDFDQSCSCRKPGIGMLIDLQSRWPVLDKLCFLVGDSQTDLQAAIGVGFRARVVSWGEPWSHSVIDTLKGLRDEWLRQ